ncbi:MAG TPA: hypothetical protein VGV38_20055 [Pyrinomonadaceae bacterium]|nr:hypothetical protein [Pyrinomonadaceae bacterium]
MRSTGQGLFTRGRLWVVAAALLGSSAVAPAFAQQKPAPNQPAQKEKEKGTYSLKVSKSLPHTYTLKATNAPLTEIAAELGKSLKAQVQLSPLMTKQRVTTDFSGLTYDAALRMLAPQVFIDFEVGGGPVAEPKPLAVYLYAFNEQPPSVSAVVKNSSEAMLIEGDTEEGTEEYEKRKKESSLEVSYAQNQLTVHATKQPLTVVLYKIANEIGVPFDLRHESSEIVNINFTNFALDQAMRSISPSVRFYFRADLQTSQILPLRIALVAPDKT